MCTTTVVTISLMFQNKLPLSLLRRFGRWGGNKGYDMDTLGEQSQYFHLCIILGLLFWDSDDQVLIGSVRVGSSKTTDP